MVELDIEFELLQKHISNGDVTSILKSLNNIPPQYIHDNTITIIQTIIYSNNKNSLDIFITYELDFNDIIRVIGSECDVAYRSTLCEYCETRTPNETFWKIHKMLNWNYDKVLPWNKNGLIYGISNNLIYILKVFIQNNIIPRENFVKECKYIRDMNTIEFSVEDFKEYNDYEGKLNILNLFINNNCNDNWTFNLHTQYKKYYPINYNEIINTLIMIKHRLEVQDTISLPQEIWECIISIYLFIS